MENIIKKSIDGGYACLQGEFWDRSDFDHALLDKNFWQALGKACVWDGYQCVNCGYQHFSQTQWQYQALRFHEINLTQSWDSAVKWLEELVVKE